MSVGTNHPGFATARDAENPKAQDRSNAWGLGLSAPLLQSSPALPSFPAGCPGLCWLRSELLYPTPSNSTISRFWQRLPIALELRSSRTAFPPGMGFQSHQETESSTGGDCSMSFFGCERHDRCIFVSLRP